MKFERSKYNTIGTANIKDINKFEAWIKSEEGKHYIDNHWSATLNAQYANDWNETGRDCFYDLQHIIPGYHEAVDIYDKTWGSSRFKNLKETYEYLNLFGQSFDLLYIGKGYAVICNNNSPYLIPLNFLSITEYKDYSEYSVASLKALGASDSAAIIPSGVENNLSMSDIKNGVIEQKERIASEQEKIEALKKEQKEELERLKKELEAAYQDKFDLIRRKMDELKERKANLEKQLLVLDTEIYGIRCYNGEAVKFTKLKNGKRADDNLPVIVHQKIRFLDEEMGKLLSIYGFDGTDGDLRYFELALKTREDIRDIFLPQEKCICFVRVSKTGLINLPSAKIANMLATYKKYHGDTIGILIRNGQEIYMGWTTEDRVKIQDENAFYGNKKVLENEDSLLKTSSTQKEMISRYFIYAILQGVIDSGKLLCFPEKISVIAPTPYIVFSMADAWIEDNRFGSFADIIKHTQRPFHVGDMVLTMMHITRDDRYQRYNGGRSDMEAWNNDRGRGEKNRTHDAYLCDCTIYPVNHIDRTDTYTFYSLVYPKRTAVSDLSEKNNKFFKETAKEASLIQGPPELESDEISIANHKIWGISTKNMSPEEVYLALKEKASWLNYEKPIIRTLNDNGKIISTKEEQAFYKCELSSTEYAYFISAEKEPNWDTGKRARANLQFFEDEVINLTYLNSVWVRYAINNRNLGSFYLGGSKVDYADAIRYLNKLLPYLDERETKEAALLSSFMELYEDWQVDLSEWKMKNNIHYLTETRAKRFVKDKMKNVI